MTIRGIGKRLEYIVAPYAVITIILTYVFYPIFSFKVTNYIRLLIPGILLLTTGLSLHIIAAYQMIKGFTNKKLVTNGMFAISRNPMYNTIIFLIIPGISLLINSWLAITSSVLMLVLFLLFIKEEDQYLTENFKEEYLKYKKKVGLFLPKTINFKQ
jgi:protein-S-isoprenylcysteine O-methyltransferase Ste14